MAVLRVSTNCERHWQIGCRFLSIIVEKLINNIVAVISYLEQTVYLHRIKILFPPQSIAACNPKENLVL